MQSQENCPKTGQPCLMREACATVHDRNASPHGKVVGHIINALNLIGIYDGVFAFGGISTIMQQRLEYDRQQRESQRLDAESSEVLNLNCNGDDCIVASALRQSRLKDLSQSIDTVIFNPER